MQLKKGVTLAGLQLPMRKVLILAEKVYKKRKKTLVVTSGLEGTHSAGSLHYYGFALDFRTRFFTPAQKKEVAKELQTLLGSDYDVVLEGNHLHVEYQLALKELQFSARYI